MMILASTSISFLSVILFIISLGVLVIIHELGHLSMAKLFKVYCFEFSVGFGPAIWQKKPKKEKGQETIVSLRAIPLGGYVAMYGESETIPEGVEVPPERSLLAVKKWKRAIIVSAGIILNFVLGYVLFAANTVFFPQRYGTNQITVVEKLEDKESPAHAAGLTTDEFVRKITWQYIPFEKEKEELQSVEIKSYTDLTDAFNNKIPTPTNAKDKIEITFYTCTYEEFKENPEFIGNPHTMTLSAVIASESKTEVFYGWETMGISFVRTFRYKFGTALKVAGEDWWESTSLIAKTLAGLFVGKGYDQIGGPVAILQVSSQILNYGFGSYLMLWGMISVNLAIFNLLPFPGLDGWHLLVIIVEGITKKEIPSKVKNIVSTIGMILLFALMAVVFIKDIIGIF